MPLNFIIHLPSRQLSVFGVVLLSLMISACSSRPKLPSPEEQVEKLAAALDNGGYKPARSFEIGNAHDIWMHNQTAIEVEVVAPTEQGSYPLILYLPSLGEDAKAGRLWRETWAKAGYAVFSIQPLIISQALKELGPERGRRSDDMPGSLDDESEGHPDDEVDKTSSKEKSRSVREARKGDLRYLGREYFAVDALKSRMEQLFWAYQQLKIRVGMRQSLYAAADLSKVILAGYDLGSQTVTAVLGEDFKMPLPANTELEPIAAIVLSPSVDLAEGNVRNRFQALRMPMLVITGNEDNDPYAISSAPVRTMVWEDSPPSGKYLLSLKGGSHQLLNGSEMGGRFGRDESRGFGGFGERESGGSGGEGRMMEYGGHGRARNGGGHSGGGLMGGRRGNGDRNNGEIGYKQVAAILSTSLAFLDAVIKNDEFARFWIEDKANKWLDKAGSLMVR